MSAANPRRRPATEEISGLIERVTFHNDENGFCVLRVKMPGREVIGSLPSAKFNIACDPSQPCNRIVSYIGHAENRR
jgi:hypothetical protein